MPQLPKVLTLYTLLRHAKKPMADLEVRRLEVDHEVQKDVQGRFAFAHQELTDLELIDFSPSYTPRPSELFRFTGLDVAPWLKKAADHPQQHAEYDKPKADAEGLSLKAYLGVLKDPNNDEVTYYFQLANSRHVLDRSKLYGVFRLNNKYVPIDRSALAFDDNLMAVIEPTGRLLFRSFRDTSLLLDLTRFFREATDEDIRKIMGSDKFHVEDGDVSMVHSICDDQMRRMFAILQHEGTIDKVDFKPNSIAVHAKKFGIEVNLTGKPADRRIVFPTEKPKLKALLKFLCDDFYESLLTGDPCVSNSHRKHKPGP